MAKPWMSADLKWGKHNNVIIKKGSCRRLFLLKKLKRFGVCTEDLREIYQLYVRPIMEYAAPVWHPGSTCQQSAALERIQKRALRISLGSDYTCYTEALCRLHLNTLKAGREFLCLKFSKSMFNSPTFRNWSPATRNEVHNRGLKRGLELSIPFARFDRYKNSAISYLSTLLNTDL